MLARCTLIFLLLVGNAVAENWPHWRGPHANGTALANPPTKWSATDNVKWKVELPGRGSGSPIIWDQRVFVVTAVSLEQAQRTETSTEEVAQQPRGRRRREAMPLGKMAFKLLCLERSTGKLIWERTCTESAPHEGTHSTNGFASASPCTDGEHVYAHFGSRGLYCYTLDGELKWKRDDFGKMQVRHGFGEGSSPTLVDHMIVVPWDHEGPSSLFALDKLTGETIWSVDREEASCWATPLIVEVDNAKQVVMNGPDYARSYDLTTGEELWWCAGQTQRPVASPVANQQYVFVGSGYRGAFLGAFDPTGRGDLEGTDDVAWTIERDCPDIASLLLSSDRIYFHKAKTGILSCVDAATGEPHYMAERLPDLETIYASPIAAGGHVYLTDRKGTTVVIKDSNQLEILATNSVGEVVDATPAPIDNELFIRGEKHLFCISES